MANTGKIYKILCNETGEVYYGSTTKYYLCNRKSEHVSKVKRFDEGKEKLKCESYNIIKRGNFTMSLVEEYSFDNIEQLRWRERHYIENNECVNTKRPIATKEEQKIKRWETEKIRQQKPEVHEKKLQSHRDWYARNKDSEERKQRKAESDKKYRDNCEHIECECGSSIKSNRIKDHLKTQKHQNYLKNNQ
jgi:hypothetical protein